MLWSQYLYFDHIIFEEHVTHGSPSELSNHINHQSINSEKNSQKLSDWWVWANFLVWIYEGQQYLPESTSINQPSHRHYWHTAPHSPLVQGSSDVVHLAQHIFQHLLHPRLRAWSVWVEQNLRFPASWEPRLLLLMGSITWSGRQSAWLCVG